MLKRRAGGGVVFGAGYMLALMGILTSVEERRLCNCCVRCASLQFSMHSPVLLRRPCCLSELPSACCELPTVCQRCQCAGPFHVCFSLSTVDRLCPPFIHFGHSSTPPPSGELWPFVVILSTLSILCILAPVPVPSTRQSVTGLQACHLP